MNKQEYIAGLRELADVLETIDDGVKFDFNQIQLLACRSNAEQIVSTVKAIGGRFDKLDAKDSRYYTLARKIGGHEIHVFASKDRVCSKVTVTREVTEYVCPPSLLAELHNG